MLMLSNAIAKQVFTGVLLSLQNWQASVKSREEEEEEEEKEEVEETKIGS